MRKHAKKHAGKSVLSFDQGIGYFWNYYRTESNHLLRKSMISWAHIFFLCLYLKMVGQHYKLSLYLVCSQSTHELEMQPEAILDSRYTATGQKEPRRFYFSGYIFQLVRTAESSHLTYNQTFLNSTLRKR